MFKRNQIEEAILRAEGHDPATDGLETRVRLKRLLDSDRKRAVASDGPFDRTYAFYSAEAPGSGQEVHFSAYEVFALWVGLRLLASGYPQGRVVFLMRYYRAALEREHKRIVTTNLSPLFRKSTFLTKAATDDHRERLVREGRLVERINDKVFLAVQAEPDPIGITTRYVNREEHQRPTNICRGPKELLRFMQLEGLAKRPVLLVELTNPAYQLEYWLARTHPSRRGRR